MAEHDQMLSPQAQRRMDAALPELLGAVRARRRRRHARRTVTVLLLVCVPIAAWWAKGSPPARPRDEHVAAAPRTAIVDTDPTILARCSVATVERAQWYVDDAGLQELLRADDRDAGLVRIGDRVLVSKAAIDPLPGDRLEAP